MIILQKKEIHYFLVSIQVDSQTLKPNVATQYDMAAQIKR
ncbi:hypothetical protein pb186bvf_001452 [Paramecium bursaria]